MNSYRSQVKKNYIIIQVVSKTIVGFSRRDNVEDDDDVEDIVLCCWVRY